MRYIASCSFGKDSLASVILALEHGEPLDEVLYCEVNYYNGVDRGRDYTGLANYLFNHWTPEVGGHRWKGSRKTLQKPDYEEPTTVKRNYTEDKPPRPPKGYVFVEAMATKYGYLYYIQDTDSPRSLFRTAQ